MPRRGREAETYHRKAPTREPYDFVLIVCEGEKSEPNYFKSLRDAYRLSSLNVHATSAHGSDPMSIVRYAEDRLPTGYDRIYCVFDRNGHANFDAAIAKIAGLNKVYAIPSIPCFEIWVLLHFRYTTAPFERAGNHSACDMFLQEVKKHLADYRKGHKDLYGKLEAKLGDALKHAGRLQAHNAGNGSCNPSTQIHLLVEYLGNLKAAG